jgi:hypothetical protein
MVVGKSTVSELDAVTVVASDGVTATYVYIGDADTDGSWRISVSTTNLIFDRRESGAWVEKGAFTA